MQSFDITNSVASSHLLKKRNKCSTFSLLILLASLTSSNTVFASPAEATDPPDDDNDVTIIGHDHGRIEEYRIAGHLYMIKVAPKKGPPYYLIDSNGDGNMDTRQTEIDQHLLIPSWTLFRWK